MKKCDLTWSILSTVVDYTEDDIDSPYKEMNHSPIYNRFEDTKDLILDEQSDLWNERFKEVSCNLYSSITEAFLMDNTPMKLFFDSGASRSYLSKKFYDTNKSLHKLPKFVTSCTGIKIGNGSIIPILFVIPIQFMAHGHIFEVDTIVAEIDDGMDLVFGFKNMTETEGRLNTR